MKYLFMILVLSACASKPLPPEKFYPDLVYSKLLPDDKIKIDNCVLHSVEDGWEPYIDVETEPVRPGVYTQPDKNLKPKILKERLACLEQLKKCQDYERTAWPEGFKERDDYYWNLQ